MSVTMHYGGNSISPVPMINIGKTFHKTAAGIAIGTLFEVTLNGNIVQQSGGLPAIFSGIGHIRDTFDEDGKYFKIECDGNVLFEGYPRITQQIRFNESQDNWVFTCPYSLTLEFDHEPVDIGIDGSGENVPGLMPPYISNYEDNWSFEFDDSISKYSLSTANGTDVNGTVIRATHDVSAVGKSHWIGPGNYGTLEKNAWEWAKDLVNSKLNVSPVNPLLSGILNVALTGWNQYNHMRVQRISESEGTFGVNETYILKNRSDGVLEDFTVEIRSSESDPFVTVGINGNIQGLETRSYNSFNISTTKYEYADAYFNTIKDSAMIYPRAQALVTPDGVTLNTQPLTKVIGRSPTKGTISYSYEYNSRPSNCIVGSRTENIQIQDDNPIDVFSRVTIMGRPQGPIFQSFNTITDFKRTVSVDLVMTPPTGCTISTLLSGNNPSSQVSALLCGFEQDLKSRYTKVYKERDSVNWDPKNARYNRTVSWGAVPCDSVPPISLCSGA